jgi:hypothetical protein
MSKCVCIALAVCALLLLTTACFAQTMVTPSNMQGWVLSTLNGAAAQWTVRPPGNGLGDGALWAYCGGEGSTSYENYPGQIWMGTNAYNGTKLSDIELMSYKTWTTNAGIYKNTGTMLKDRWSGPRSQFQIQMCIDPGDGGPKKILYYRPNGDAKSAPYVDGSMAPNMTQNQWTDNTAVGPTITGYWLDLQVDVSATKLTSWDAVKARFPNGSIAQPAQQPPTPFPYPNPAPEGTYVPWPNPAIVDTPNACGISLFWGAEERGQSGGLDGAAGSSPAYHTPCTKNWWRESLGGISWVDDFKIITNTAWDEYDFEPEPGTVQTEVAGNVTALMNQVTWNSRLVRPFVAYGLVKRLDVTEGCVWLEDGGATFPWQTGGAVSDAELNPTYTYVGQWVKAEPYTALNAMDLKVDTSFVRAKGVMVPGYSNRWFKTGRVPNRLHVKLGPGFDGNLIRLIDEPE